ncbi:MAG: LPS export ABC transporter periplasmic protein LptC [Pseudomonadales bacterium]
MRASAGRWWLLACLVVCITAAALLLAPGEAPRDDIETAPEPDDQPDLYMENAVIRQFRDDGSLTYRLSAAEIRHYERDQLTRLTEPRLTLLSPDRPPWEVQASSGYLRRQTIEGAEQEVVFLRENVVLEQRTVGGELVRLTTASLYLYPDREYAETEHDVIIDADVGRTLAVGLEGDLQRGLLKLLSVPDRPVHTILLPDQFKSGGLDD